MSEPLIDPTMLEVGTETDALVAESMGCSIGISTDLNYRALFGEKYCDCSNGESHQGVRGGFAPFSSDPGMWGAVLWPWLCKGDEYGEHEFYLGLTMRNGYPEVVRQWHAGGRWEPFLRADDWPLLLCRTVVAVAKARSRQ